MNMGNIKKTAALAVDANSSLAAVLAALEVENARRAKLKKKPLSYGKFVASLEARKAPKVKNKKEVAE